MPVGVKRSFNGDSKEIPGWNQRKVERNYIREESRKCLFWRHTTSKLGIKRECRDLSRHTYIKLSDYDKSPYIRKSLRLKEEREEKENSQENKVFTEIDNQEVIAFKKVQANIKEKKPRKQNRFEKLVKKSGGKKYDQKYL